MQSPERYSLLINKYPSYLELRKLTIKASIIIIIIIIITSEGAKDGFIASMTLILRSMGKTNTNSTLEILKSSSFMI